MQILIPDALVNRAEKAANWYFGKDTPEIQINSILEIWCDNTEFERAKEEAALNAKITAAKEAKKHETDTETRTGR